MDRSRSGRWLALAMLVATPSAADWLVLRDGTRIETDGPWQEKGRQVVFTRVNGALSTLRLADVDLEASRAATAERPAPEAPAPEGERPRAVLRLTDDDIRPAVPDVEADGGDSAVAEPEETAAETAPEELVTLVSWESRESRDVDGLEILGRVRNQGDDLAAAVRVKVSLRDENGALLSDSQAFLRSSSLAPGQSSSFRVMLPGIYTLLVDPTFEVSSERITVQGPRRNDESEEDDSELEVAPENASL